MAKNEIKAADLTHEELLIAHIKLSDENKALKEQMAELAKFPAEVEALKSEKEELLAKIEELSVVAEKGIVAAKAIVGTYVSKKHKVTVRFKDGFVKTNVHGQLVSSEEVIANENGKYTALLDHFIEVGAAVIEVVEK
jgi:hypothetical protein